MPALPDTSQLDAIAARITAHAGAARSDAARLSAAMAAVRWKGRAADAFHLHTSAVIGRLQACAGRLDDAAAALYLHAANVEVAITDAHRLGPHDHPSTAAARVARDLMTDPADPNAPASHGAQLHRGTGMGQYDLEVH